MDSFGAKFQQLTGYPPLAWQSRLYATICARGLPEFVDVPTGLGKTSVMAIWLLARASGYNVPRRLVYVVDRRAVVDQATTFAIQLRSNLTSALAQDLSLEKQLPISTLRGKFADNREWLEDPSVPAIVVGTVDMIGSRLLFDGYGVSPKMRPYHAGLLGADSLVVLDESHLVPPFEALLRSIQAERLALGPRGERGKLIPPFRLMSLSATGTDQGRGFRFQEDDLMGDSVAHERWNAKKSLTFHDGQGKTVQELTDLAWDLSEQGCKPIRCLVFCNERDTAEKVLEELRKRSKGAELELLVGARRIYERERVKGRLEELGFLEPNSQTKLSFLIATSAGEVGVDLDAEHMVCDLVAWERMVQRLGRVNRRGKGSALIRVLRQPANPKEPEEVQRLKAVTELLHMLPTTAEGGLACSPGALRELKQREDLMEKFTLATTPPPLHPWLERAHLDAWSMTSLLEQNPGRAETRRWIRGWIDDEPQTVVCWRRHLPVRGDEPQPQRYRQEVDRFFEAAPVHLSEQLETETSRVADWLRARALKLKDQLPRDKVVGFVLGPSGELRMHDLKKDGRMLACLRLTDLAQPDKDVFKNFKDVLKAWLGQATLVLDHDFGGLSSEGLLSEEADGPALTLDSQDEWQAAVGLRVREDVAYPSNPGDRGEWVQSYRFAIAPQNEQSKKYLVVEKLRTVSTNEDDRSATPADQRLEDHQRLAEQIAEQMAGRLQLPEAYCRLLGLAARHHDEGKAAANWQRAFRARPDGIYAKTRGPIDFEILAGYRHEFGSLPLAEPYFQELPEELRELGLHLIAAHHGQARPFLRIEGCQDAPPSLLRERAAQVALRFARMQNLWGPWGLAWWESLLRAVDQKASRLNLDQQIPEVAGVAD